MNTVRSSLRDISEIRSMMERSSKFLSLSGLSGVTAGVVALVGAALLRGQSTPALASIGPDSFPHAVVPLVAPAWTNVGFTVIVSLAVLVVAVGLAMALSIRMARRKGLPVWTKTTKYLLVDLGLPLAAGGAFTGILITKGLLLLAPSSTLVFYGLALLNASRYTVSEIRLVALSEVLLGIAAAMWIWYGLLFWALGFGLLHILYGVVIYWKYER
jgi:hypothetical protein